MEPFEDAYVEEQNKIASAGVWLQLLEISTPGYSTLRYVNNTEDIAWAEASLIPRTYSAISFIMDDVSASLQGEFPEYRLVIGDVTLTSSLRTRIKATSGLVGSTIRFIVVHSSHLDVTTPAIDELAEVLSCEVRADGIALTLGIPNLMSRRFPRDRYMAAFCRHKYGGGLCQYVSPTITSNTIRFTTTNQGQYALILITPGEGTNFITNLLGYAAGSWVDQPNAWRLSRDTYISVEGSLRNDGWFVVKSAYTIIPEKMEVYAAADGGRAFSTEAAGATITITLHGDCDHTLEACKLRNNSQNFGGSPGIAGGVYG